MCRCPQSPPSGNIDDCTAETQTRSRENGGAWSAWSGVNRFPECTAEPTEYETRVRWQEAEVIFPMPCVGELQVRMRPTASPNVEASFGGTPKPSHAQTCPAFMRLYPFA